MNNISNNTPAVIYIFGGTGDLSRRKLIPALYNLYLGGWLHENFSIVCIGTSIANRETLVKNLKSGVDEFSRSGKTKKAKWEGFEKKIELLKGDFTQKKLYSNLKKIKCSFEKNKLLQTVFFTWLSPQNLLE